MDTTQSRAVRACWVALLVGVLWLGACGDDPLPLEPGGSIAFEPVRPTFGDRRDVDPYTGNNEVVIEAQERYATGLDLHRKVIARTCTPFDGVCHNNKEYPDLRTPGALLATVDAPCNVQPQEITAVYDRCEPIGDRFRFSEGSFREIELSHVALEEGEEEEGEDTASELLPGLHLYLRQGASINREELWGDGQFVRAFVNEEGLVQDHIFFTYTTRWNVLDGGSHLVGEVRDYQRERVKELLSVGLRQGDWNQNGVFGGERGQQVPLLNPGNPEESYLIARLRGQMLGEEVPGSLMPLANQPLSIAEMLALFCFVEGLGEVRVEERGAYMSSLIDYRNCSYSDDPEGLNLLGAGVTWEGRVSQVLRANCGSCHDANDPQGLDLVTGDVYTRLLTAESQQMPGVNMIEPGSPEESYLWRKLNGGPDIVGGPMPININGNNRLSQAQLDDINTWIVNGATNDG